MDLNSSGNHTHIEIKPGTVEKKFITKDPLAEIEPTSYAYFRYVYDFCVC